MAHQGKNAFWLHRTCNYIQGEYTIEDRVKTLKEIVEKHSLVDINWEDRG
jgi:coenzyme F420-reducing hydrogenase delta subunit